MGERDKEADSAATSISSATSLAVPDFLSASTSITQHSIRCPQLKFSEIHIVASGTREMNTLRSCEYICMV